MNSSTENRNKIESIFFGALNLESPEAVEVYLEEACGGDQAIKQEVEELLAAKSRSDSFVDQPVDLGVTTSTPITEGEGSEIGRYKLLQKLGEGGFGLVFMAEQTKPVTRKVALKIVKPGMDSREVIARFEAERQALAMMDHPNIAKVLDAGTTDTGRPYFVMELVKGISITEYCDANNLSTKDRLNLFMQVCRAVQHAHQKGIIHRDLKPSNVMVTLHDGVAVPKVIDFGVSKALSQKLTEKTLFTRYGQIVGTPQYMSPEQAEMSGLDVDTRSDIYSLGVLLYELLTGRPPFDAETLREAGFDGMRRMIREEEPIKPSNCLRTLDKNTATMVATHRSAKPDNLHRSVEGDLDWIVMKSLEKDRNRRYETANGLMRDIERHLSSEAVLAGPPSFAYQVRKLYQRHRAPVLTAAAIATMLLLALCGITFAWQQALRERQVALLARQESEEQRRIAEDSRTQAVESQQQAANAANTARAEAQRAEDTLAVLIQLLSDASPNVTDGKDATVVNFLDDFSRRLELDTIQDTQVERQVRFTLGLAYRRFSAAEQSYKQFDRAEILARQSMEPNSVELAEFLLQLATTKTEPHLNNENEKDLRDALAICSNGKSPLLTTRILTALGTKFGSQYDDAEQMLKQAIQSLENLSDTEKSQLDANPFSTVADLYRRQDRNDEALRNAELAVSFARRFLDNGQIAISEQRLSEAYRISDDISLARKSADDSIRSAIRHLKIKPNGKILASALDARAKLERFQDDEELVRETALRLKAITSNNWNLLIRESVGNLLGHLTGALLLCDETDEANEILALTKSLPLPQQAESHNRCGNWLRDGGRLREGYYYLSHQPIDSVPLNAFAHEWTIVNCARAHHQARNFATAIDFMKQATERMQQKKDPDPWSEIWIDFEHALLYQDLPEGKAIYSRIAVALTGTSDRLWGELTAPIRLLSELRRGEQENAKLKAGKSMLECVSRVRDMKERDRTIGLKYASLGEYEMIHGDLAKAADLFVKATKTRSNFSFITNEWISDRAVELLTRLGETDRLVEVLREEVRLRDTQVADIHPERAFVRIRLAEVLIKNERDLGEAKTLLTEARKVYDYHGDWIPKAEHKKLDDLLATANAKTEQTSEATP